MTDDKLIEILQQV